MSILDNIPEDDALNTFQPVQEAPSDLGIASAGQFLYYGLSNPASRGIQEWSKRGETYDIIRDITGKEPAIAAGLKQDELHGLNSDDVNTMIDDFIVSSRESDERFKGAQTRKEIEDSVFKNAEYYKQTSEREMAKSTGATIAGFAGSFAGSMTDPINLGASLIGWGEAKIAVTIAREAIINAGVEAVEAPWRADWVEKRGGTYGLKEFATDVTFGAAFGAALPPAFIAGKRVFSFAGDTARNVFSKGHSYFSAVKNAGKLKTDATDAVTLMAKKAYVDEMNPVHNPTQADTDIHIANLKEAQEAFNNGRQPTYNKFEGQPSEKLEVAPLREAEVDEKVVASMGEDQRLKDNFDEDFARIIRDNPTEAITIDGETMSLQELSDSIADEDRFLAGLKECAL